MTAYCTKEDLLTGDIPLAGRYGDGSSFVQMAADEIDAQIGHRYVTPVELDDSEPAQRPSALMLKKINQLLASGRIILDMAAGGEDDRLHAYGRQMLEEALLLLSSIGDGNIVLTGAELIESKADDQNDAVSILNVDEYSLVEEFYTPKNRPLYVPIVPLPRWP